MIITSITSISQMNELLSKFVIFVLMISFQSGNGENFYRQVSGSSFANFVKKPYSKLTSPILASLKLSTLGECVFECLATKQCFSINFATESGADNMYECELLNAGIFNQADKSVASGKFHYYHNKSPCTEHPCKNGGSCFPTFTEKEYICKCTPGYSGKHCEMGHLLICEGKSGQMRCKNEEKINVLFANYGRLDSHSCPHWRIGNNTCHSGNSIARVQQICQSRSTCELKATNAFFGDDPCPGIHKYLFVEYRCQ